MEDDFLNLKTTLSPDTFNRDVIPIFHYLFDSYLSDRMGNNTLSSLKFFRNVLEKITDNNFGDVLENSIQYGLA